MGKLDLSPFVFTTEGDPGGLQAYGKPFSVVDVAGNVWNVATNRVWLVAVEGKAVYGRWKGAGDTLNMILNYIQCHKVDPYLVSVAKLQEWTTKGSVGLLRFPSGRYMLLQLHMLATVLQIHTKDTIELWDAKTTAAHMPCLGLAEPGRRAVLMGYDKGVEASVEFDLTKEAEPVKTQEPPEETPETGTLGQHTLSPEEMFDIVMDGL